MEEPDAAESPAPEGVGMQSHSDSSELSASDLSSDDLVDDDGMASCEVTEALIEEKVSWKYWYPVLGDILFRYLQANHENA